MPTDGTKIAEARIGGSLGLWLAAGVLLAIAIFAALASADGASPSAGAVAGLAGTAGVACLLIAFLRGLFAAIELRLMDIERGVKTRATDLADGR